MNIPQNVRSNNLTNSPKRNTMRTCRWWGGKSSRLALMLTEQATSHYPRWASISRPVILWHINKCSLKKGIFFLFHSACISCEQLYVTALWPLSHHRHDHRNPQPFVYRRAPVYGLMVILVVCLWHEPDSQLLAWAWHWGHRDRWQPNAFYCLPLPLVSITSVMNTAGTTWHESLSLSAYISNACMYLCAHILCVYIE